MDESQLAGIIAEQNPGEAERLAGLVIASADGIKRLGMGRGH
nr:hypothetical protein [uncultured Celeribacter sp.]